MTKIVVPPTQAVVTDAFELDLRVITAPTRSGEAPCPTDDGCGQSCNGSACVSQC